MFNRIAYDLQLFMRLGLESTKFQSSWRLAWITIIKGGEDSQAYVMFVHCSLFDMLNHDKSWTFQCHVRFPEGKWFILEAS